MFGHVQANLADLSEEEKKERLLWVRQSVLTWAPPIAVSV